MRKQIITGFIAAVALLSSVFALTSSPALGDDYASYPSVKGALDIGIVDPVPCGGPISGAVTGGTAPYTITVAIGSSVLTTTLASSGAYAFAINAGIAPAGATTYSYSVVDAAGMTATGTHSANISYTCTTGGGNTGGGNTGGGNTGGGNTGNTGGTTTTAADFGFNNAGIPTQPSLAITGTDTGILGFIATGLIALGAVAMGSRRKLLQGALED